MGLARQKEEARPYCSVLYIIHTRARSILPLVKMSSSELSGQTAVNPYY